MGLCRSRSTRLTRAGVDGAAPTSCWPSVCSKQVRAVAWADVGYRVPMCPGRGRSRAASILRASTPALLVSSFAGAAALRTIITGRA